MTRFLLNQELKVDSAYGVDYGRDQDPCVNALLTVGKQSKIDVVFESFDEKYYQAFDLEIRMTNARIRIMDFAKSIYIDEVVVNSLGERELSTKVINAKAQQSPLYNAYDALVNFANKTECFILKEVGLEQVGRTMKVLWDIKEKVKR